MNIKKVTLKYYIIDAEILFSRAPFMKENTEEFSYVKPFKVFEAEIPESKLAFGEKTEVAAPFDVKN